MDKFPNTNILAEYTDKKVEDGNADNAGAAKGFVTQLQQREFPKEKSRKTNRLQPDVNIDQRLFSFTGFYQPYLMYLPV